LATCGSYADGFFQNITVSGQEGVAADDVDSDAKEVRQFASEPGEVE
jgi:hypothetical protein